jgi:glyoxylase-like metal-dependent hydrolase (beta-lactamase superfamily II)
VTLEPIDLRHGGAEHVIGSYLVETDEGPAIFDCGPTTGIENLEEGLAGSGLELAEVRHLLLSHIHLDHAGAAGVLVRRNPKLQVHVSAIGAPHLIDPSRLERSARRLYGDAFDDLWGELAPVPEENVHAVGDRVLGLDVFPSTGHADHHVCYFGPDGTLYAGDAAGVRIQPERYVAPPAPPPEFDLEAWDRTLDEIERRAPARLAIVHFGVFEDPQPHLDELRARLYSWTGWVAEGMTEEEFLRQTAAEREWMSSRPEVYERAMPLWQSYAGIRRYVDKRAEAA